MPVSDAKKHIPDRIQSSPVVKLARAIYIVLTVLWSTSTLSLPSLASPTDNKGSQQVPQHQEVVQLPPFLTGGDISLLTQEYQLGTTYKIYGNEESFFKIAKRAGWNCMRLRLWVNPSEQGIYVNDLAYTEKLGRQIKDAGFKLDIDIHYSDTWADPGHQYTPAAWVNLTFPQLTQQVHDYTSMVVSSMIRTGAAPDIVQIGNEITNGMLWPDGVIGSDNDFTNLAILLKAASQGVDDGAGKCPRPQVMIHIDRGGDWAGTQWFFDNINAQGVPFDIIGLSYYPEYHGPISGAITCINNAASKYGKPVVFVETGYNYDGQSNGNPAFQWPFTPVGQADFLSDLVSETRSVPNGLGEGVIYWAPEWIPAPGMDGSWDGMTLFDDSGNVLPGAFMLNSGDDRGPEHF